MSNNDLAIMLEHFDSRFDLVIEVLQTLIDDIRETNRLAAQVPTLSADGEAFKRLLVKHDIQLEEHEQKIDDHDSRISRWEMPARA